MGTAIIDENAKLKTINERMNKISVMEKDLFQWDIGIEYNEMPMDVVDCTLIDKSPFSFWTYYFSFINKKILAIEIGIEEYNLVKEHLQSKFGSCIDNGYCVKKDFVLLLKNQAPLTYLKIYYDSNILSHYKDYKKIRLQKEAEKRKRLEDAF